MKEDFFKSFNDLVFQIAHQFYVWRDLQKKENNSGYNARSHYWITIISTLQHAFLLNLANIFDEDDRLLTVHEYLNHIEDEEIKENLTKLVNNKKHTSIVKQLIKWRNNYLAHKNKYFTMNSAELSKKFPCKYDDIEILLELLIYILDVSKRNFESRNATCYIKYYQDLCKRCEEDVEFVIENGLNTEGYKVLKKEQKK